MDRFDVETELETLKSQTKAIRKRSYSSRRSRLDRYKDELLSLHRKGASAAELHRWLRANRIKVVLTTVTRWLDRQSG